MKSRTLHECDISFKSIIKIDPTLSLQMNLAGSSSGLLIILKTEMQMYIYTYKSSWMERARTREWTLI